MSSQTPRKFTSVADMKRKKNRGMLSPSLHSGLHRNPYEQDPYQQPLSLGREQNNMLKSFNSSPDLQSRSAFESNSNDSVPTPPPMLDFTRRQSSNDVRVAYSEYSRPFRPALRPKTPPPPPPENKEIYESRAAGRLSSVPPPQPDPDYSDSTDQEQDTPRSPPVVKKQNAPRPEPALPPAAPIAAPSTASKPPPPPPPPPPPFSDLQKATSTARKANITVPNGDCRGISAEALTSVTLKPATTETKKPAQNAANGTSRLGKGNMDFHDDLRNALAKRRSKVSVDDDEPIRQNSEVETTPGVTVLNKCGGLSLRESVRENVQTSSKTAPKLQHSPPGFGNKKDSGYTSSRTSLEPSECGDEPLGVTLVRVHDLSGKSTPTANDYRVSILSQQLEDNYGTTSLLQQRKEQQDTMLVSSPGSSDFSTIADRPLLIENPLRTPDADYDDPNSGTADTDHESCRKRFVGFAYQTNAKCESLTVLLSLCCIQKHVPLFV
ncbi:hypothetical protein L596_030823 [Steinernema carpocapsae]|uniref:Uncharacterized protein n=1 Tax=Steinernema carpocapsae TaxID=34508 RepID=A0A4U5LN63_STECR|nr:hypothetical protein L596_030823 [Steinernema carpocapsae]